MSKPTFGITINRDNYDARPAIGGDMSVIGLVGTAPDAIAASFPLNRPVLVNSNDPILVASLGASGTLPKQFDLINAALGDFQASALVVIVRVAPGADEAATLMNLVGNSADKSGIHALLRAGPELGVVPRLVAVPCYTHQRATGVSTLTVTGLGEGYLVGDAITGTGGNGSGFLGRVSTVDDDGGITGVEIVQPGDGYLSAPAITVTSEDGSGATIVAAVDDLANVVCAALPAVCSRLFAHAVVSGPHSTLAAYREWRETLNSERLIPLEPWVKLGTPANDYDAVGSILGIGVRRDHEKGGLPFHSWANQPVYGIVGPNRDVEFSLFDGSVEAQQILASNGGVIVRGEGGVDSAIASGGFVYIGTDNAGDDELWRFYNVTRGRDYLHLLLIRAVRQYLGKYNITGQTIESILETVKAACRDLKARGAILDFKVGFNPSANSPEQLRLGSFTLAFKVEEAPVLRHIGMSSGRYPHALNILLDQLAATLDVAA